MNGMSKDAAADRGVVFLCEDEPIVALDVKIMIEEAGYTVAGPFSKISSAFEAITGTYVAAILDVRLRDGDVFPVAEELARRGVPLIFHSAHIIEEDIARRFPSARYCPKPLDERLMCVALNECAFTEP